MAYITESVRIDEQARRQRIMDGVWRKDVFHYMLRQLGAKRTNGWGGIWSVDTGTCLLREVSTNLATLYLRPPEWQCMVDGELDPYSAALMQVVTETAQYPVQMTDVLAQTVALNDYAIRTDVQVVGTALELTLYPTTPARILYAVARVGNTRQASEVHEEVLVDGSKMRRIWTDDTVTVVDAHGNIKSTQPHEQGRCPWTLYHATGRPALWSPTLGSDTVEGTYSLALDYSYARHNRLEAAWSQRWGLNVQPAGHDTEASDDGTAQSEVLADPTTVLLMTQIDEQRPGQMGQWNPAVDPETMGRAVAREHGRLSLAAAGSDVAVYRKSGNAESAYAMAITREAQREQQVAMAPRMAPSDSYLAEGIAAATNAQAPGLFPAGAVWRQRYRALPPSMEELERIEKAIAMGLMSEVDALMAYDPFATRAEAEAQLGERVEAVDTDSDTDTAAVDDASTDVPEGTAADLSATDKAADVALNGAQVQAAQSIVESVALGQLPRESAVAMLMSFFGLPKTTANAVLGTVGGSFTPEAPEAPAPESVEA
jgi:hypothetical protein